MDRPSKDIVNTAERRLGDPREQEEREWRRTENFLYISGNAVVEGQ